MRLNGCLLTFWIRILGMPNVYRYFVTRSLSRITDLIILIVITVNQALRDQLPTALTIRAESDICGGDEMRGAARAFRDVAGIDGKKMGLGIPDSGAVVTVEGRGSRVVGHRKSGDGGEEEVWM